MSRMLSEVSRRVLLAWLTAGTIVTPAWARPIHGGVASGGGGGGLMSVQITLGATTYTYNESGGTDLGNFTGPSWTQKNILGVASGSSIPNFEVRFRQDTTGGRKEVIFTNYSSGNMASMSKPIPPAHTATATGGYTVQIFTGGVLETGGFIGPCPVASSPAWSAGTITASDTWFGSEWRWQSALRPIINTPATIMSNGWMLNFGTTGITATLKSYDPSSGASNGPNTYLSPMDSAGLTKFMPTAGNQQDVGLIPTWTAQWMIQPNASYGGVTTEFSMRSTAEASHSVPQCFRDDATHGILDLITYPTAGTHSGGSSPNLLWPSSVTNGGWTTDNAHFPANAYIAFCATGDPYHLEGLIFEGIGGLMIDQVNNGTYPMAQPNQDRAYAWQYRSKAMIWAAMKIAEGWGALPAWIGGSSGSAGWAGACQADATFYYNTYTNNAANLYAHPFGAGTLIYGQETWESEYIGMAFQFHKRAAAALSTSVTNLTSNTTYKTQAAIDRTSGLTGWPASFPCPYSSLWLANSVFYNPSGINGNNIPSPPGTAPSGDYPATWGDYWNLWTANNTCQFDGYLDASTGILTVTSITANSIGAGGGRPWTLNSTFMPDSGQSTYGLQLNIGGTGSGGTGTYLIDPSNTFFGFGWTFTQANPCVASLPWVHGMSAGDKFQLTNNAPGTGVLTGVDYFVLASGLTTKSFQFSLTAGGIPVAMTSGQTGRTYLIPYLGSVGTPVAMTSGNIGNAMTYPIYVALGIDQYNGNYLAQAGEEEYATITQALVAAAVVDGQSGASAAYSNINTITGNSGQVMTFRWCFQP